MHNYDREAKPSYRIMPFLGYDVALIENLGRERGESMIALYSALYIQEFH